MQRLQKACALFLHGSVAIQQMPVMPAFIRSTLR
jgi:hypothetical protein